MAITIDDIYDKEFALKGGGYDRDDVDQFLDEICDEMTNMQEKITSLESDLQKAQDELKAAREAVKPAPVAQAQPVETPIAKTSSTLESILLSAQRLADEEVEKAKEKAAQIIKDAEDQASRSGGRRSGGKGNPDQKHGYPPRRRSRLPQVLPGAAQKISGHAGLRPAAG